MDLNGRKFDDNQITVVLFTVSDIHNYSLLGPLNFLNDDVFEDF